MNLTNYDLNFKYSTWFESMFAGRDTANIRIHLNDREIKSSLRDDFHQAVARQFKNNYSRRFYPGVRRSGRMAKMLIYRHREQGRQKCDGTHLHILVEIPQNRTIEDVREFVSLFCKKPRKDYCSDTWHMNTMHTFYVEEATNLLGSSIYNAREGMENLLELT